LVSHVWVGENYKGGGWEKQRTFAFEERECRCCGHFEARPLPEGEEES
jgi:hypothetical protein